MNLNLPAPEEALEDQVSLLGRGLLVDSQRELEVTAGKGNAGASPDEPDTYREVRLGASGRES